MKRFLSFFQRRPKRSTAHIVHLKQNIPQRPRLQKSRFIINHARKYKLLAFVVCGCIGFFVLFLSPLFQVQHVEVVRKNLSVDTAEIESWMSKNSYGSNIFFLSLIQLNEAATKEFPQWKSIRIRKKFPNTLYAEVENYKAYAYVFIKREIVEKTPEKTEKDSKKTQNNTVKTPAKSGSKTILQEEKYVINERGTISYPDVGENPEMAIRYIGIFNDPITAGKNIIPAEVVQKIDMISKQLLKEHELATKEVLYFPEGKEIHVNLYQFSLWFDLLQDSGEQLKKFSQALSFLDKNKMEYMDLRIDNRVIYKEKKK